MSRLGSDFIKFWAFKEITGQIMRQLAAQFASKRHLIIENDLLHMSALCVALKRAAAPLPFWASLAKADDMLPDS